jgi:prevent-host-death family protein
MTTSLDTADVKARFSEMVSRVAFGHERLVVLRRGKPTAALISIHDLQRLEVLDRAAQRSPEAVHPIMRAFGGWAGRDDLDELVAEIYADRAASGREVAL